MKINILSKWEGDLLVFYAAGESSKDALIRCIGSDFFLYEILPCVWTRVMRKGHRLQIGVDEPEQKKVSSVASNEVTIEELVAVK